MTRQRYLDQWLDGLPPMRRLGMTKAVRAARFDPAGFLLELCAHDHRLTVDELVSLLPTLPDDCRRCCSRAAADWTAVARCRA